MNLFLIYNKKDKLLIITKEKKLRYFDNCRRKFKNGKSTKLDIFYNGEVYTIKHLDTINLEKKIIVKQLKYYNKELNNLNIKDFLYFYKNYPIKKYKTDNYILYLLNNRNLSCTFIDPEIKFRMFSDIKIIKEFNFNKITPKNKKIIDETIKKFDLRINSV